MSDCNESMNIIPGTEADGLRRCCFDKECLERCCPSLIAGPTGPTGPTGPRGTGSVLFSERPVGDESFADGEQIPVDFVSRVGTDLSYDAAHQSVKVEKTGTYYIHWALLVRCSAGDIVVTLEDRGSGTVYARSGGREGANLLTASTALALEKGVELVLRNRSGRPVLLGTAVGNGHSWSAQLTALSL